MPAGKSSKCLACNCAHRAEIERRLIAGESGRKVSAWLKREHKQYISDAALSRHKREHLPVVRAAREKVEAEAAAGYDAAVVRVVADAALLDLAASYALDTVKRLAPAMADPSMAQATAYGAALREIRGAVGDRHEMLNGDRPPSNDLPRFIVELTSPERPPPCPPPGDSSPLPDDQAML